MGKKQLFDFLKGVEALHEKPKPMPVQYKNNALNLHYPVMIENVKNLMKEYLNYDVSVKRSMMDCTLGLGGHSLSLLDSLHNLFMYLLIILQFYF